MGVNAESFSAIGGESVDDAGRGEAATAVDSTRCLHQARVDRSRSGPRPRSRRQPGLSRARPSTESDPPAPARPRRTSRRADPDRHHQRLADPPCRFGRERGKPIRGHKSNHYITIVGYARVTKTQGRRSTRSWRQRAGDGATLVLHTLTSILQVWTHSYPSRTPITSTACERAVRPQADQAAGDVASPASSARRLADDIKATQSRLLELGFDIARPSGRAVHAGA